jgi:hypothetical protein
VLKPKTIQFVSLALLPIVQHDRQGLVDVELRLLGEGSRKYQESLMRDLQHNASVLYDMFIQQIVGIVIDPRNSQVGSHKHTFVDVEPLASFQAHGACLYDFSGGNVSFGCGRKSRTHDERQKLGEAQLVNK